MRADMERVLAQRRHRTRRGPAYRFLRSRLGRPWNSIFAEICQQCRGRDGLRQEFLRHVELHVQRVDSQLLGAGRWGKQYPLFPGEMYVCPNSGLLELVKERARRDDNSTATKYVRIDGLHQCRVIAGAWHMVTLKRLPPNPQVCRDQDVVLSRPVRELKAEEAVTTYGDRVYAVASRKMTEAQLIQYGITQTP